MIDREKVIKAYEDFVNGYECFCTSDDYEYEMHREVLALLKEQEKLLHKKQKDIDRLCAEISELKHRFHERTEIIRCGDCKHGSLYCTEDVCGETLIECNRPDLGDVIEIHGWKWFCADGKGR